MFSWRAVFSRVNARACVAKHTAVDELRAAKFTPNTRAHTPMHRHLDLRLELPICVDTPRSFHSRALALRSSSIIGQLRLEVVDVDGMHGLDLLRRTAALGTHKQHRSAHQQHRPSHAARHARDQRSAVAGR